MPKTIRVLYAEEPSRVREQLAISLSRKRFHVERASSVQELTRAISLYNFDAVLIDSALPGATKWIARRRGHDARTALVLLVDLGDTKHTLAGYRAGATFCLQRPLTGDALAAHLKAVLAALSSSSSSQGELAFEPTNDILRLPDGREVKLTSAEHRLFVELARNAGHTVTRARLRAAIFDGTPITESGLGVTVNRLRNRLGEFAWMLRTVRRTGYCLAPSPHKSPITKQPKRGW